MSKGPFTPVVGQQVARLYGTHPPQKAKIVKILKPYVKLEDGTRWRYDGYECGATGFMISRIVDWSPEYERLFVQAELLSELRHVVRDDNLSILEEEEVRAVLAIFRAARQRKQKLRLVPSPPSRGK